MGRYKRKKKQFGGMISNMFGGFGSGQGMEFISQIGNALQGFSNEPALQGIFSQSNTLFEGFNNALSNEQKEQIGDTDKFKSMFDIFSLFSNSLFQTGGQVSNVPNNVSDVKQRFGQFTKDLEREIAEVGAEQNKQIATLQFNAKHSGNEISPSQIIPGLTRGTQAFKKGSRVSNKISLLRQEGKPQNQAVAIALDMQRRGKLQDGGSINDLFNPQQASLIQSQAATLLDHMRSGRFRRRLRRSLPKGADVDQAVQNRITAVESMLNTPYAVIPRPSIPGAEAHFVPAGGTDIPLDQAVRQPGTISFTPEAVTPLAENLSTYTPLHEFSHASTLGARMLSEQDFKTVHQNIGDFKDFASKYIDENSSARDRVGVKKRFRYLTNPTEVQARVNEARQMALDMGIHKNFGENFTKKQIELLLDDTGNVKVPKGVKLEDGNFRAFNDLIDITGGDAEKIRTLLNDIAAVDIPRSRTVRAQNGGVPVNPLGQFAFPGQNVIVPTSDGSIDMTGVPRDILAVQNGGATVLPANSGIHQFAPGMVLEIPLPENYNRRGESKRSVNSSRKKRKKDNMGKATANKTTTRYHRRNKRQTQINKRGNVGLPFGRKVGF